MDSFTKHIESDSNNITIPECTQRKNSFSNRRSELPSRSPSVGTRPTQKEVARPRRGSPDPEKDRPTPEAAHNEAGTNSTVHPSGREVGQTAQSGNPTPEKQVNKQG